MGACLGLGLTACGVALEEVPADSVGEPPIVEAGGERLQGLLLDTHPGVAVFKGIPYADPPVGIRRWQPPAPLTPREGTQQAVEYGPACIQDPDHVSSWYRFLAETFGRDPDLVPDLEPTAEDCLHLNVWTANLGGEELLPVMVWIHGGSNTSGSPSELPYDGANITAKGVVVVSLNYRLNVFGFLAHPALTAESDQGSSGNYGLLDQIAALQWIQRNISVFGGDPDRVMIFGESAGATNVAYLMSSPLASGLFHRALLQSGGYAVSEYRTLAEVETMGEQFVEVLRIEDSNQILADLRRARPEDLLRGALEEYPGWNSIPSIDGWVIEEAPARVFDDGDHVSVPMLIGFNSDEWTTLGRYSPEVTLEDFRQAIRSSFGDLAERALEIYPASTDTEAAEATYTWQTDSAFACPSRFIADRVARTSERVFFYEFSRRLSAPGGDELGAYHGAETAYVMNNLALETWVPRDDHDQSLAELMSDYWVRFAATGDPNGEDLPLWPAYSAETGTFLELGDEIEAGAGVRTDACDLYDELQDLRLAEGGLSPQAQ